MKVRRGLGHIQALELGNVLSVDLGEEKRGCIFVSCCGDMPISGACNE